MRSARIAPAIIALVGAPQLALGAWLLLAPAAALAAMGTTLTPATAPLVPGYACLLVFSGSLAFLAAYWLRQRRAEGIHLGLALGLQLGAVALARGLSTGRLDPVVLAHAAESVLVLAAIHRFRRRSKTGYGAPPPGG